MLGLCHSCTNHWMCTVWRHSESPVLLSPGLLLALRRQIPSLNMSGSNRRTKTTSIELKTLILLQLASAFQILLHAVNNYNYIA